MNEVTGQDWRWFFDETFFSSGLCDYSISVKEQPRRRATGFADGREAAHAARVGAARSPRTRRGTAASTAS